MKRFDGILLVLATFMFALPVFAGIATGPAGDADTVGMPADGGEPGGLDVSLNVTFNGPTSDAGVLPQPDAGYEENAGDLNAKSLLAFSNSAKTGGYNYYWWWWWNRDHDGHDCDGNCYHRGGGCVVPEPGSMLLLGMGLSALALRRRAARK